MKELLKNAFDKIYWIDEIIEFKTNNSYPSLYETKFGNISTSCVSLKDYYVDVSKIDKLHRFLNERGFDNVKQPSLDDHKNAHYYNEELKIQLSVVFFDDITQEKLKKSKDDEDIPIAYEEDSCFLIIFTPILKHKENVKKFFEDVGSSGLWKIRKIESNKFYMIAEGRGGLYKQETTFKNIEIKDDRYDLYYGRKFPHHKFVKFVKEETENLLLLHGDPGTGKSNYIKNLIMNSEKDVIYIPPSMMGVISSPGFVSFMTKNKNNILLIEDAEEILSSDRNAATNNLLGLTDGFLKDSLNLKIICTFNCDLKKIDDALKRKGRLFFEYKFEKLSVDECIDLVEYLDLDVDIREEMTLAEIFNFNKEISLEDSFEERRIGFLT